MIRVVLRIAYWLAAIALLAVMLTSLDYTLAQAVLIGLIFCPFALALEYLMPKAKRAQDKIYLSIAALLATILLILVLHHTVWSRIMGTGAIRVEKTMSPMLINPAFLGLILTAFSLGDYFWAKWLSVRFKPRDRSITFFSERKSVTLLVARIAYVESNDTEVRIVTDTGEIYRNKTGIGQWANLLGNDFLRIHRSYLVNIDRSHLMNGDTVCVGDVQLPVSRKYKENVALLLSTGVPNTSIG